MVRGLVRAVGPLAALCMGVAACAGGEVASPSACRDHACREAWVLAHFEGEPERVAAELGGVGDPVEGAALVDLVVGRWPERGMELCRDLAAGPAGDRCRELARRPHLFQHPPAMTADAPRAAPGQGTTFTVRLPAADLRSSLAEVVGLVPPECADQPDASRCVAAAAEQRAARGSVREAAAACLGVAEALWRDECLFQAAQARAVASEGAAAAEVADLCLLAGDFRAQCLAHATLDLAVRAAARADREGSPWPALVEGGQRLEQVWATRDPAYGALAAGRYWSEVLERAYAAVPQVTGEPLDHLPAVAFPHVRASAAARHVQLAPELPADLDAAVAELARALEARGWERTPGRAALALRPLRVLDLWPLDRSGDEVVPAVAYRSQSRRGLAGDERADLAVCLLEAAARTRPAWRDYLRQGLLSDDPVVRWTAERLRSTDGRAPGR